MHLVRCGIFLATALLVAACQTTGSGVPTDAQAPIDRSYHLFFSPADHVDELLAQGQVEAASQVWTRQQAFFVDSGREAAAKSARALRTALSARLAPRLDREAARVEALAWPATRTSWPEIRSVLADAAALKAEIEAHKVLPADGGDDERLRRFLTGLDTKTAAIRAGAATGFRADDETFFADYPVRLAPAIVLAEARASWSAELDRASPSAILAFRERHGDGLDPEGAEVVGRLYFQATLGSAKSLDALLKAVEATRAAKLPLKAVPEDRIAVVEIAEAPTPAARLDPDLPFAVMQANLESAFERKADLLLIVDARSRRSERRVVDKETVESEYQRSVRHEDNPQYTIAKADLRRAERDLRDTRRDADKVADRCTNLGYCIGYAMGASVNIGGAERDVARARDRLLATPPTIAMPTYRPYSFTKTTVEVTRSSALAYYLVDRSDRVLAQGVLVRDETSRFAVPQGLDDRDRNKERHLVLMDGEAKMAEMEATPVMVPLSAVMAELSKPVTERRTLPAIAEVRRNILADRTKASNRR